MNELFGRGSEPPISENVNSFSDDEIQKKFESYLLIPTPKTKIRVDEDYLPDGSEDHSKPREPHSHESIV